MVSGTTAALYAGSTWHGRREPVANSFRYRTFSLLVDLDDLDELEGRLRLLRVERPGVCSLRSEDHVLPLDADQVRAWLAEQGVPLDGGRVSLLTSPRVLGHVFNPLSLWWCHAADGRLAAVIAEVHNTVGGRHAYLLQPDARGHAGTDKVFYVSPFLEVAGRYVMRLRAPAERFMVHIGYERRGARVFDATWQGRREPLSDRRLARLLALHPLWTARVTALIHWQALVLWLRRVPVVPRPRDARLSHQTAEDRS